MYEQLRSPSEYFIRFLISTEEVAHLSEDAAEEIKKKVERAGLDGMYEQYILDLSEDMEPRPDPYIPQDAYDVGTKEYLKAHRIYDMWHPTKGVRESRLIVMDFFLREKLDPLLLSTMKHSAIARKLRKFTSIALTSEGVAAYAHYFWNRKLMRQSQWMQYLQGSNYTNPHIQSMITAPDVSVKHLPYVIGLTGPGHEFNSAEAASRIGQIAYKHALEIEHKPASLDNTMALKNCMITVEKVDTILRRSDVALKDVLKQFHKFKMKLDDSGVASVAQLTEGNYSKSGEGTDLSDDDDNF